ncbi:MAG: stage III sporulation protein D [Clostridiales bacterium]|nr:stage III sporulation protein D [Clostridiales bacterium]
MRQEIALRCQALARYMIRTGATVRQAAKAFGLSKSSVHKDVHERLKYIHPGLHLEVKKVLAYHQAVRHIRGGMATRQRWKLIRDEKMARLKMPGRNDETQ